MPLAGEEPHRYGTAPRQAGLKPASTVILSLDGSPAGLPMGWGRVPARHSSLWSWPAGRHLAGDKPPRYIFRCGRDLRLEEALDGVDDAAAADAGGVDHLGRLAGAGEVVHGELDGAGQGFRRAGEG